MYYFHTMMKHEYSEWKKTTFVCIKFGLIIVICFKQHNCLAIID